jgi:hypothetical protein
MLCPWISLLIIPAGNRGEHIGGSGAWLIESRVLDGKVWPFSVIKSHVDKLAKRFD